MEKIVQLIAIEERVWKQLIFCGETFSQFSIFTVKLVFDFCKFEALTLMK